MQSSSTGRKHWPARAGRETARAFCCLVGASGLVAAESRGPIRVEELASYDLETLLNIEVISVGKKEQKLSDTPAAVYVITPDEIRRSGITTLPELFRLVPGMQVGRVNAGQWAITSRGFNDPYADKLLVMVDGKTIYTPVFGGVFWGSQDVVLEDLDRIEVVRGPGGTIWGANAVNGVINVITKSAKETQGLLMSTTFGTLEQPYSSLRYGGQIATNLHYRVYAKYQSHRDFDDSMGRSLGDDWRNALGGLRLDWEPSESDRFTLKADYRDGVMGENYREPRLTPPFGAVVTADNHQTGGNILGRWEHRFSEESDLSIQAYYDRGSHGELGARVREQTFDLESRHRFWAGERNEIVWGIGYRYQPVQLVSGTAVAWTETEASSQLVNFFAQDEITLVEDRLALTLGSKFEHNDFTGFEIQPSARLLYTPGERHSLWGAVSRAVRTPTHLDTSAIVNFTANTPPVTPLPTYAMVVGNPDFGSEELTAYELGYRIQPHNRVALDAATFYNTINHGRQYPRGTPFVAPGGPPRLIVPIGTENVYDGAAYGVELSANWNVTDQWRLRLGYTWLDFDLEPDDVPAKNSPEQTVQFRSELDLTRELQLNGAVYFVDQIMPRDEVLSVSIPSYARLDVGVSWRPVESLEIGVWGQNLLEDRHPEFARVLLPGSAEIPRSIVGRLVWTF